MEKTPKCCGSCKNLYKLITEEPCNSCEHYNKWVLTDNLKQTSKLKNNRKR